MPLRNVLRMKQSEVEELFPLNPTPLVDAEAVDKLQSQLTDAFEGAIDKGMHPMDALGVILSWMSSEMMRIRLQKHREIRRKSR